MVDVINDHGKDEGGCDVVMWDLSLVFLGNGKIFLIHEL
jgi:hypothetical protein